VARDGGPGRGARAILSFSASPEAGRTPLRAGGGGAARPAPRSWRR